MMPWYVWLFIAIAAIVVALVAVVLVRTLRFLPAKEKAAEALPETVDARRATETLRELVRCKTVSHTDPEKEDDAEFIKLEKRLPKLFPAVFAACPFQKLGKRSLLLRWKGRDSSKARVMMAHYDVVPVEEELWSKPAFEGIVEDGVLWGRGTLDTKGTLNGALCAAEELIKAGFVPENDVYFAFSGNEETNGDGAPTIVNYFKQNGIAIAMVCDEGGAVVENVFPGVKQSCALIGIAEKGIMNLQLSVKGKGGHASAPPPKTAVNALSEACVAVQKRPFPRRISKAASELFDTLGRRSTFAYRMIFANLWLFGGLLDLICKQSGGELNALMRTTAAFTQMSASKGPNVIPPSASMVANLRIMSGETTKSAAEHIRAALPEGVELSVLYDMDPSAVSRTDGEEWERMRRAVSATWQGVLVSPYLMLACSDSRHYGEVCDCVYRFCAMALSKEERGMIHGNDERIPLETIAKTVEFYKRLLRTC